MRKKSKEEPTTPVAPPVPKVPPAPTKPTAAEQYQAFRQAIVQARQTSIDSLAKIDQALNAKKEELAQLEITKRRLEGAIQITGKILTTTIR